MKKTNGVQILRVLLAQYPAERENRHTSTSPNCTHRKDYSYKVDDGRMFSRFDRGYIKHTKRTHRSVFQVHGFGQEVDAYRCLQGRIKTFAVQIARHN